MGLCSVILSESNSSEGLMEKININKQLRNNRKDQFFINKHTLGMMTHYIYIRNPSNYV